jgi:hypothetical protein
MAVRSTNPRLSSTQRHDQSFRPPAFNDLIIHQLQVGTFDAVDEGGHDRRPQHVATFLDILDRIE